MTKHGHDFVGSETILMNGHRAYCAAYGNGPDSDSMNACNCDFADRKQAAS